MSTSKRRHGKGYHTPYRKTTRTFSKSQINTANKDGSPRLSIIKTGPVSQDFFEQTIQNARIFSRENNKIILDYYPMIIGVNSNGEERRANPFTKRDIFYGQSDDETWQEILDYLSKPNKDKKDSLDEFTPKFIQLIFILDRTKKTESFGQKQLRSLKQKIGREEAARERALQAKEKKESDIRKKRAALKTLREKGIIAPAKKKKRFIK